MQMTILAVSDTSSYAMWGISLVINVCIVIGLSRVSAVTRKFENLEAARAKEKGDLEQALHVTVEKLVDERFRSMSHTMNNHVQQVVSAMDSFKERLEDGDETFESLSNRNQKIELEVAAKVNDLRCWMQETFGTKNDQREHAHAAELRAGVLADKLEEIGKDVAVLKSHQQAGKRTNG
jgi:hypothetical protein